MKQMMIFTRILIVFLLVALLAGCAQNMISKGQGLIKAEKYQEAQDLFQQLIKNDKSNPVLWRELGFSYYKLKEYDRALVALNEAIPEDVKAYLYLGLTHEKMKNHDLAIDNYLVALRLYPRSKTKGLLSKQLSILLKEQMTRKIPKLLSQEQELNPASIDASTIAVLNFDDTGLDSTLKPIARGMAEMVSADLDKVKSLKNVERMRINAILDEHQLAQAGLVDTLTANQIGQLLGARKLITASMTSYGQQLKLDGTIIDVIDSVPTFSDPTEARMDEFYKIQKNFVFLILDSLNIDLSPLEREAILKRPTESYLAFLAYCRGLELQNQGSYQAAQQEFSMAIKLDPGFSGAQEELGLTNSLLEVGEVSGNIIGQLETGAQNLLTGEDNSLDGMLDLLDPTIGADNGNTTATIDPETLPVGSANIVGTLKDE